MELEYRPERTVDVAAIGQELKFANSCFRVAQPEFDRSMCSAPAPASSRFAQRALLSLWSQRRPIASM